MPLGHVKPHGALYNDLARNVALAAVFAEGVRRVLPGVVLIGLAGSPALEVWKSLGFPVMAEGFSDRRYLPDGSLVPRSQKGAVIDDPVVAAEQESGCFRGGKDLDALYPWGQSESGGNRSGVRSGCANPVLMLGAG